MRHLVTREICERMTFFPHLYMGDWMGGGRVFVYVHMCFFHKLRIGIAVVLLLFVISTEIWTDWTVILLRQFKSHD